MADKELNEPRFISQINCCNGEKLVTDQGVYRLSSRQRCPEGLRARLKNLDALAALLTSDKLHTLNTRRTSVSNNFRHSVAPAES